MTAKLAKLDINTDDSPSTSNPSFSPLNSTSVAASDDHMSDEKPTETGTEAMITMGLPTKFTSTPLGFRKQTSRKSLSTIIGPISTSSTSIFLKHSLPCCDQLIKGQLNVLSVTFQINCFYPVIVLFAFTSTRFQYHVLI
uniref:Ovule protein n=1 Tax=Panagrellus redivivus TaxID=6233 RepID=A0A7E4URM0_PANRE